MAVLFLTLLTSSHVHGQWSGDDEYQPPPPALILTSDFDPAAAAVVSTVVLRSGTCRKAFGVQCGFDVRVGPRRGTCPDYSAWYRLPAGIGGDRSAALPLTGRSCWVADGLRYAVYLNGDLTTPIVSGIGPDYLYGVRPITGEVCAFETDSVTLPLPLNSYTLAIGPLPVEPSSATERPSAGNDRLFVLDTALEDRCRFRSEGPLQIQMPITRFAGATNTDGTLRRAADLIASGMLAETSTLRIAVWDVDSADGERSRVLFNGEPVKSLDPRNAPFLSGSTATWRINSFRIPTRKMRFPSAAGVNGQAPQPASNTITIEIDTSSQQDTWCTTVDWCELTIGGVMSPIVLVHGNGSAPDYFDRFDFTGHFQQRHAVFDNTLLLPAGSIDGNAAVLRDHLARRSAEYGVDSLHLVAHSKGGLDGRGYISLYRVPTLTILSLATWATPHDGSVAADLALAARTAFEANARFVPPPSAQWPAVVAGLLPESAGWSALQTENVAQFNTKSRQFLIDSKAAVFAAGADADVSGDARISVSEASGFIAETPELSHPMVSPFVPIFLTQQWNFLRGTQRLETGFEFDLTGQLVLRVIDVPVAAPRPNDLLVTIASALGQGPDSVAPLLRAARTFTGPNGLDHYLICGPATAQLTLNDLIAVERTAGDLSSN